MVSKSLDILLFFSSIFFLIFLGYCGMQYFLNIAQNGRKEKHAFAILCIYYCVCCIYLITAAGKNI